METFVTYAYRIESHNDEGHASSRDALFTLTAPTYPCCSFSYRLANIQSTSMDLIWSPPARTNGLNTTYVISVRKRVDIFKAISDATLIEQSASSTQLAHNALLKTAAAASPSSSLLVASFQHTITNLVPYTQYVVSVQACNSDLFAKNVSYCLLGTPSDNTSSTLTLNNTSVLAITSQDKPELQSAPVLLTANASCLEIGVARPQRANGVILFYEVIFWR